MSKQKQGVKLCKHCKTEIPWGAKVCPNCKRKQGGVLKWVIIAFVVIGIIGAATGGSDEESGQQETKAAQSSSPIEERQTTTASENKKETETESETETEGISEEEYKSLCGEYTYKDVLRNPENYIGEKIKITLKISSVHEAGILNPTKYYFAYSESDYGWYGDRYAVYDKRGEQDPKLLSDDIITIWGEIADPTQTSSLIVNSEEVFVIDMKYVEIIEE